MGLPEPSVSNTALSSLTVRVTGRFMLESPMMQPVMLPGCKASVNTVTELASIGPVVTGAGVLAV